MIFVWIRAFLLWLLRLFIPPPRRPLDRINPAKHRCPACGNVGVNIQFERIDGEKVNGPVIVCQCQTCVFRFAELPVSNCERPID